jgi:starch-binding outer membrane protein, SusD/RagB family
MKKSIYKLLIIALTFSLSSCGKDFLEQSDPNSVSASEYFKTENDILLAVNGIYQSLRSSNCIGENSGLFNDERSDDGGRNDNQSNAGEPFQFNDFSLLPSNTYLENHWSALYETITRCNAVLSNIDNITFNSSTTKDGYKAEAKFLRALIYFHLVRKWGPVPLVTKQLTSISEVADYTYRETRENVYTQIVSDLTDVVNSELPNKRSSADIGRVSKAAGNALLGQVFLTMYTTLGSSESEKLIYLENAKTYLTNCYGMKTFTNLKDIPYTDVFDVNKKSTCPELIFQIVNKQGDKDYSSSIAANNQAKGETINSLITSTGVGGRASLDLVNEYESNDLRKAFTVKFANNASVKDYFITKYRDASSAAGTSGYGGNDWILIRYADIILMLSEVYMYAGDETKAIQYLNMVRERAQMPTYEESVKNTDYNTKFPTLKLAILHERRVELAFEHHRWFDLLRFFTINELVTYFGQKKQSEYGTAKLSNFSTKDQYFPIPYDEYKLDPLKMYQNDGY